ncbi:class I SAM-dependent DNA methyltransferase [Lewinella sp. IMCC34183]|uniref:class I SAM-dependent DNA methyltransferase n=1 Tax=Lewinella sp. IMCC34183 TaxID=2248762 RepID=UPI000E27516C|nr:class I SAM-dependent methyltransferase [Lewinella sp. IMCC34183]
MNYDRAASNYERFVVKQRFETPALELAQVIIRYTDADRENVCIDLGTGTGIVITQISKLNPNFKIYGLDSSSEMLQVARSKGIDNIIKISLPSIPFPANTFDVVSASFVFSHVREIQDLLKNIKTVLKPSGFLVFTTWGEGQTAYNSIWSDTVKSYLSDDYLNEITKTNIPSETFFEEPENVVELMQENGFLLVEHYVRQFSKHLSLSEYLDCRYSLLTGSIMENILSENLWQSFKADTKYSFSKVVGDSITYVGNVNFFVFKIAGDE